MPRGDFLDQPPVAVGVAELDERRVARPLAAAPPLLGEWCTVDDRADVDAEADKLGARRDDVRDDQSALQRPGGRRGDAAGGAGRGDGCRALSAGRRAWTFSTTER
jgi:hypothetical protein